MLNLLACNSEGLMLLPLGFHGSVKPSVILQFSSSSSLAVRKLEKKSYRSQGGKRPSASPQKEVQDVS